MGSIDPYQDRQASLNGKLRKRENVKISRGEKTAYRYILNRASPLKTTKVLEVEQCKFPILFSFGIVLPILGFFSSHMKLRITVLISTKWHAGNSSQ